MVPIQSNWKFDCLERKFNLLRTRRWPRILPSFSPLAWPSRHLRIEREYSERIFCQSFRDARRKRERCLPREEFKSNGGESPAFAFQTGGSEEKVEEARRETRAFLFGDVRRTCFLLWRHLFFRGYRVCVVVSSFSRGVKLERTLLLKRNWNDSF